MSMIENLPDAEQSTPVTYCPPGKRSQEIVPRAPVAFGAPIITQTALKWPEAAAGGKRDKIVARNAIEADRLLKARDRNEALSVALAQPHRSGSDDAGLECELGRFCFRAWPTRWSDSGNDLNADHRRDMFNAGLRYGEIVHQHRVLLGLGAGSKTQAEGGSVELTDAQLRAKVEAARIKRDDADAVLREIFSGAVSAMMRICVEERPLAPTQEDLAKHCLWRLALHFGIVKRGRFGGVA